MYTRQKGLDFWMDFDDQFLWKRTGDAEAAFGIIFKSLPGSPLDNVVSLFRGSYLAHTFPTEFGKQVAPAAEGFRRLAELQLAVMDKHFAGDPGDLRLAFEEFGQGVLFDPRRAKNAMYTGHVIHMMDGSPDDWVGFHRWHAFARAAMLSGADTRWADILKFIALAWSIQTELNPRVDDPANTGLEAARLAAHRTYWLAATIDRIDTTFALNKFRAPKIGPVPHAAGLVAGAVRRYERVQKILEDAVGGGHPIHDGKGRFWDLPYQGFMQLKTIYGVQVIADPGPNRGARSGLVCALKGQPPFGPGGLPRMPLNRPPVSDENIAFIEKWIDDGCPDDVA